MIKGIGLGSIFLSSLIATSAWGVCVADLEKQVEVIVQSPRLRSSRVGFFAARSDSLNNPIVNIDGDKYFTPASNMKLFTSAAALEILGANYQIKTSLLQDRKGENLWVRGGGDPSFSENSLIFLVQQLVQALKEKGVKAIASNIQTIPELKGSGLGWGWEWQDLQEDYAAIADSFIINENVLDWIITPTQLNLPVKFSWDRPDFARDWIVESSAITVSTANINSLKVVRSLDRNKLTITGQLSQDSEPELGATALLNSELHFLNLLRSQISKQGISFKPTTNTPSSPEIEVATILSPKLSELIKVTNKQSNNLYAESLLRRIGISTSDLSAEIKTSELQKDSSERGIELIEKFLKANGISEIAIADGSGLSSLNLVTPRAIAQLLAVMRENKVFRESLAIAGVDGTLKNRFKNLNTNIQAKTGTKTGIAVLSGYMQPPKYPELVFSIVMNNSTLPKSELIKDIDAIALLLNDSEVCNSTPRN